LMLMKMILKELTVHTTIEENHVYPIVDDVDHGVAAEAFEEHHVVKILISELESVKNVNESVIAKMKVLRELVKHHIREEENELFGKLKKSGTDLNALGKKLLSEKQKLKGAGGDGKTEKTMKGEEKKSSTSGRQRKSASKKSSAEKSVKTSGARKRTTSGGKKSTRGKKSNGKTNGNPLKEMKKKARSAVRQLKKKGQNAVRQIKKKAS